MKYESKFSVGDCVWLVRSSVFHRIAKCDACDNTGRLIILGDSYICPKCEGRAARRQYSGDKFYIYGSSVVGKVTIEDCPRESRYRCNPNFTYMVESTGVGSGTVWYERDLFATKEEAMRFCDGRNGGLPADECELLEAPR